MGGASARCVLGSRSCRVIPTWSCCRCCPGLQTGGVERGTVEMVRAIVGAGGRALVASAGGRMVEEVVAAGGVHVVLPLAGKTPWRIAANARRLALLARREGVRLIHARSRAPAWAAWLGWRSLAAGGAEVHFVTTWHGVHGEEWPGKRIWNSVLCKGERVIAISPLRRPAGGEPARCRAGTAAGDPAWRRRGGV